MSLYDKLNTAIEIADFLNDTMLFVGGVLDWPSAFNQYGLSPDETDEHKASINYWLDQASHRDPIIVWLQMRGNLIEAYRGCDRQRIDEPTFRHLVGIERVAGAVDRKLPFSVDDA